MGKRKERGDIMQKDMQKEINEFKRLYDEVFDELNCVKPCGRQITCDLIALCSKIKPEMDFGNVTTGFMNVGNVIDLYIELT